MSRTHDEILSNLDEEAEYELVVSLARQTNDYEGDVHLALVTVDGVTRGVVSRESTLEALETAADNALLGNDAEAVRTLRATIDEVGFDRAIELLERARNL